MPAFAASNTLLDAMPNLFLQTLAIRRFREVRDCILRFHPERNVLLGRNGSGKTTLLRLISTILRSDFGSISNEEFDFTFTFDLPGDETLQTTIKNVPIAPDDHSPMVSDLDRLGRDPGTRRFKVTAEAAVLNKSGPRTWIKYDGEKFSSDRAEIISRFSLSSPLERPFVPMLMVAFDVRGHIRAWNAHRFDEGLGLYDSIFTATDSRPVLELDDQGRTMQLAAAFLPEAAVQQFLEAPQRGEGKDSEGSVLPLRWNMTDLPFLNSLCEKMGFYKAEYSVEPREKSPSSLFPGGQRVLFSNFVARFFWTDSTFISNDHLSYGQRRLLSMMHYVSCNPHFVIADELVNGLHHEWISFCLDATRDRQTFLTSQNPLLFDCLSFSSAKDLAEQFVICTSTEQPTRPRLSWRNLDETRAKRLFAAYERGIQYISEILETEGLW